MKASGSPLFSTCYETPTLFEVAAMSLTTNANVMGRQSFTRSKYFSNSARPWKASSYCKSRISQSSAKIDLAYCISRRFHASKYCSTTEIELSIIPPLLLPFTTIFSSPMNFETPSTDDDDDDDVATISSMTIRDDNETVMMWMMWGKKKEWY